MGGLRQADAEDVLGDPRSAGSRSSASRRFSGFFSKDPILARRSAAADWFGYVLFAAAIVGTFLTGLYTFRMLFLVFGGEPSAYVREHPPHAAHDGSSSWSMG